MDRMTALTVFRTVVEHGSFAAASRHLGLSPAAISKNVSELEAYLSARLINRTTRRMSLTEAGTFYFGHVEQVLNTLKEADESLQAMRHTPSGLLRVSAPVTVTLVGLSAAIPKFLDRYPDVMLDLQLDDHRINLVEEGFDVALRGSDNLEDSGLIARKLMTLEHTLCGSPAYFEKNGCPGRPEDLPRHSHIQFSLSDHATTWTFQKGKRTVKVPVNARYKVSSSLAVRDALRADFGVSLIPIMYVKEDIESGRLCSALDDWTANKTALYAVYPSKEYVVPKVRVFLDFLIENLGG